MSRLSRLGRAMRRRRPPADPEHRRAQRAAVQRAEAQGRKPGVTAGSHIDDMVALKQTLMFCSACDWRWRWSAKLRGYELKRSWQKVWGGVIGKCDGCGENGKQRKVYAHDSIINKI